MLGVEAALLQKPRLPGPFPVTGRRLVAEFPAPHFVGRIPPFRLVVRHDPLDQRLVDAVFGQFVKQFNRPPAVLVSPAAALFGDAQIRLRAPLDHLGQQADEHLRRLRGGALQFAPQLPGAVFAACQQPAGLVAKRRVIYTRRVPGGVGFRG